MFEPNTDDSIRDSQIRAARKKVQRFLIMYIRKVFSLADCLADCRLASKSGFGLLIIIVIGIVLIEKKYERGLLT